PPECMGASSHNHSQHRCSGVQVPGQLVVDHLRVATVRQFVHDTPYEPVTVSGDRSHGATGPHTHRAVHEPFSSLLEVRLVAGWAVARGGRGHALVFLEVVVLAPGRGVLGGPRVPRDVGGWGGGKNTGSSRRCSKG